MPADALSARSTAATVRRPTPRWATVAGLLICLAGLGVSSYLTIAHYDEHVRLSCPATSTINCAKVTTSAESVIAGIPVAVLGLAFFLGMTALFVPAVQRFAPTTVPVLRAAAAGIGMLFVFYLVYAELFTIGAICLWCTSVHALTFLLLVVVLLGQAAALPEAGPDD